MESGKPNPYAIVDDEPQESPYSSSYIPEHSKTDVAIKENQVQVPVVTVEPIDHVIITNTNDQYVYTELCECSGIWWAYCCLAFWFTSIAGCITNRRLNGSSCLTVSFITYFFFALIVRRHILCTDNRKIYR